MSGVVEDRKDNTSKRWKDEKNICISLRLATLGLISSFKSVLFLLFFPSFFIQSPSTQSKPPPFSLPLPPSPKHSSSRNITITFSFLFAPRHHHHQHSCLSNPFITTALKTAQDKMNKNKIQVSLSLRRGYTHVSRAVAYSSSTASFT